MLLSTTCAQDNVRSWRQQAILEYKRPPPYNKIQISVNTANGRTYAGQDPRDDWLESLAPTLYSTDVILYINRVLGNR